MDYRVALQIVFNNTMYYFHSSLEKVEAQSSEGISQGHVISPWEE